MCDNRRVRRHWPVCKPSYLAIILPRTLGRALGNGHQRSTFRSTFSRVVPDHKDCGISLVLIEHASHVPPRRRRFRIFEKPGCLHEILLLPLQSRPLYCSVAICDQCAWTPMIFACLLLNVLFLRPREFCCAGPNQQSVQTSVLLRVALRI